MKKEKIIVILILALIALGICYQCGTNPLTNQTTTIDSSVFITVAKQMQEGNLPYKDVFDHKGPLMYAIDYLGLILSPNNYLGIWLIEICFMTIYLIYIHKIAKLFIKNSYLAIIPVIISTIPIFTYFEFGNYVEEYALPFIAISLYYMVKYVLTKEPIEKKHCFIIGVCISTVLLLRPNMISLWIVYCIAIFIYMIINKQYKELKHTILYFVIGILAVFIPCIIVLAAQGILKDCIQCYLIFNFAYTESGVKPIELIIKAFWQTTALIQLSVFICIVDILIKLVKKEKNIGISIISLLYIAITFLITILPKNYYPHYGIIFIPTFIVPVLIYIKLIEKLDNKKLQYLAYFMSFIIVIIGLKPNIETMIENCKEANQGIGNYEKIYDIVESKSNTEDEIIVIGSRCSIYLDTNRKPASKYIYQFPIVYIDGKIKDEFINEIEETKPKLIIYDTVFNSRKARDVNGYGEDLKEFVYSLIDKQEYKLIQEVEEYQILERAW